jgi:hypothetical protein
MWQTSTDAELIPGISHRSIGSIILLVFAEENAEVESEKIRAPHKITGIHSPNGAISGVSADKDFAAGIQFAAVFATTVQSIAMQGYGLSRFLMKIGNVPHLSVIDTCCQHRAPRSHIRKQQHG